MKAEQQNLEMFNTELNSAINGLHQEFQQLLIKYSKVMPEMTAISLNFVIDMQAPQAIGSYAILGDEDGTEESVELAEEDLIDVDDADFDGDSDDDDELLASDEEIQEMLAECDNEDEDLQVSEKLLNSNADVVLAYKKTTTNSVLFAPHHTKQ